MKAIHLLEMSLSVAVIILVTIGIRLISQKLRVSKRAILLLWIVVAVRLMIPFSLSSPIGILPAFSQNKREEKVEVSAAYPVSNGEELSDKAFNTLPGTAKEGSVSSTDSSVSNPTAKNASTFSLDGLLLAIYLSGLVGMVAFFIISYLRLARRIKCAERIEDHLYATDQIGTAFVFGFIRPRVYIPAALEEEFRGVVLKHEFAHISHGDQWYKALAYLLLAVHWFNPFVWLAYYLFNADLEYACDERVVQGMSEEGRRNYSEALLSLSRGKGLSVSVPVAFSEKTVIGRIKAICCVRKPVAFLGILAVLSSLCFGACLFSNHSPVESDTKEASVDFVESDSADTDLQNGTIPDEALFSASEIRLKDLDAGQNSFVTGYNEADQGIVFFLYCIVPEDRRAENFKYYLVRFETALLTDGFWDSEAVAVHSCRKGEINGSDWDILYNRFYWLRNTKGQSSEKNWDPAESIGFWGSESRFPIVIDLKACNDDFSQTELKEDQGILSMLQAEYKILGSKKQLIIGVLESDSTESDHQTGAMEEVMSLGRERVSDEDFAAYEKTKAFPVVDPDTVGTIRIDHYPHSVDVSDRETISSILSAIGRLEFEFSGQTTFGLYGAVYRITLLNKDGNDIGYDLCVAEKDWLAEDCFFYNAKEWAPENRSYPPLYHTKGKEALYDIISKLIPE